MGRHRIELKVCEDGIKRPSNEALVKTIREMTNDLCNKIIFDIAREYDIFDLECIIRQELDYSIIDSTMLAVLDEDIEYPNENLEVL